MSQELAMRTLDVTASGNSGASVSAKFKVRTLSAAERFKRSAKVGGAFFAAACAFVLVPFLHFIFVPLLLLASVVSSAVLFSQKELVESGPVTCPTCGASFDVGRIRPKFPRTERCPQCRNDVRLAAI